MKLGVQVEGLDDVVRKLERLSQKAQALDGSHSVPLKDLLTGDFLRLHTSGKCGSLDEWFASSPFKIENQADFQAIPDGPWDEYVRSTTAFLSWRAMLDEAVGAYVKRQVFEE
jgi:hypothetical protein